MATTRKKKIGKRRWRILRSFVAKPQPKAQIAALVRRAFMPRYSVECTYQGLNRGVDRALEKAARKASCDSGMWLGAGLRDIGFEFPTLAAATAAAVRIKAAGIRGDDEKLVRVMMRAYWRA